MWRGDLLSHTGSNDTSFLYNGRDGVMMDVNGLYYLRARYYSPELMRFINADTVKGNIKDSRTLNNYAYANGDPVSMVDPFGTSAGIRLDTSSDDDREWEKLPDAILNEDVPIDIKTDLADLDTLIDTMGYYIIFWYLYGNGCPIFLRDEKGYMESNKYLQWKLTRMITEFAAGKDVNTTSWVSGSTHMEIETGTYTGYSLMSGTNRYYGDFGYAGRIKKDGNGNIEALFSFCWNDYMDPKLDYRDDQINSVIADIISLGKAEPFEFHLFWRQRFVIKN